MPQERKVWQRILVVMSIACLGFVVKAEADEKKWSSGDPDGATAPYIGKTTEQGCQVLTYDGFEDPAEIAGAFGVRKELVLYADRLDDAGKTHSDEWVLVPGRDCGEVDWDKVDPKPNRDHGRIDSMRPFFN